ncbi:type IV secretion system DNA-binding domain-containing protein [Marinomonas sp. TI.3.20]|uniref:type IV secretion system DNA-binding domain-containing protein n=1 Tax=Marinomonas sp. TI.3.20 TaxID=3121296 RepID=UPI00311F91EC
MMRTTPHEKIQDWNSIFLLFGIVFIFLFCGSIWLTWNWGTWWGGISEYSKYFFSLFKKMTLGGSGYEWSNYWRWVERENLVIHFYMHLIIPFIFSFFISWKITKKVAWEEGGRDLSRHIEGAKLYIGKRAISVAKKKAKKSLKQAGKKSRGITIYPNTALTKKEEQSNILTLGAPGGGKTTVILPMIDQAINRNDKVFIYDEKKEFTTFFFNKKAILIAPWDDRSFIWDIANDIRNEHDAEMVAGNLIPDGNSHDPMWLKGARLIFTGMLVSLMEEGEPWGWDSINKRIQLSQPEMLSLLQRYYPIAASFVIDGSKTTQGFYVNLISELSWVETLAVAWRGSDKPKFSIREWVNNNHKKVRNTLIVQSDPRYKSIGAPLCNALLSLMTKHFLSQSMKNVRDTWLFIDEMANLPPNPSIKMWLELARSRGGRAVFGTQSISQIKKNYQNDADTILNLFSVVFAMRVGSAGGESEYVSNMFGDRIVERPSQIGAEKTWQRSSEPVVSEYDLTHIEMPTKKGVIGYLMVPSWEGVFRLQWPLYKKKTIAEEHVPAKWLTERPKKESKPENKLFGGRS